MASDLQFVRRPPRLKRNAMPAYDQRRLIRDMATYMVRNPEDRNKMLTELGDRWLVNAARLRHFYYEHYEEIVAVESEIIRGADEMFAHLWITRQENRMAAYQEEYQRCGEEIKRSLSAISEDGRDISGNHEQVRIRNDLRKVRLAILKTVAEELGQVAPRNQLEVKVVQHIIGGVDVDKELA